MVESVKCRGPVPDVVTSNRFYSAEESTFLAAVETYRRDHHKRFLAACEYLHILKGLGYTL
jgi:hypothetical protein